MEVVNNALRVASRNFSAYLRSRAQFSSAVCRLEFVSQLPLEAETNIASLCHMLDSEFRRQNCYFERHKAKPQKPRFYMFFSALTKSCHGALAEMFSQIQQSIAAWNSYGKIAF